MEENLKILELRAEVEKLNEAYYDNDEPIVSDYEYDMKMQELKKLERLHPEMYDANSPSIKVGGHAGKSTFAKVEHEIQMQSLLDVFNEDDVRKFVTDVKKDYPEANFSVEPKIDGLSISLAYKNGELVCGSTRGDGYIGEDVTENIKNIKCIPQTINYAKELEVRGEVYMDKATLEKLNDERYLNDEKLFANARNAAAGSLRQIDASLVKKRELKCFIFNVQKDEDVNDTHSEGLEKLKNLGFTIIDSVILSDADEIIKEIKRIGKSKCSRAYDIDGAVIKLNNLSEREEVGVTAKYPKWAIAYKYPPEVKTTVLRDIICQVGRTGRITPVALFDSVSLAGTAVSRATLHNQDFIDNLGIRIGDTIEIRKAAEIIPEIIGVKSHAEDSKAYILPSVCPICGQPTVRRENEADLRCVNPSCPAQIPKKFEFWASRDCMNIDGMGPSIIDRFIKAGWLNSIPDIYKLANHKQDMYALDGFGEKAANKLLNAIEKSKENDIDRLIKAFGIPGVGRHIGKKLATVYPGLMSIMTLPERVLQEIDGIGEIAAKAMNDVFISDDFRKMTLELADLGVNMNSKSFKPLANNENLVLNGKNFVITGTFAAMSREKMTEIIESNGGKVSGSISKKTDFLIAGDKAGSKLQKAEALNVKVINESELEKLLANQ